MGELHTWDKSVSLEWLQSFEVYTFRRHLIERNIPIKKGMRVLEAGSGPAHDSILFAERGAEVTALDISAEGLATARGFYKELRLPLQTIQADLRKIPIESDSFDLVWNAGTLEHFNDRDLEKVFSEMVRVAKPGGTIMVFVPNKFYLWYQISIKLAERRHKHRQYEYERAFSTYELRKLYQKFGLTDVKVSGDFVYPKPGIISRKLSLFDSLLKKAFQPLEDTKGLGQVKSLLGLDTVIWGKKRVK